MLQFYHEKMYLIIHGGDLLRHDHSNLIIGTSISLKHSDSNEFNLQDSCVWIVASISLFCFFLFKFTATHPFTTTNSYFFGLWMNRDIWGDH